MIVKNGLIITPQNILKDKIILVENNKIKAILNQDKINEYSHDTVNAMGGYILPGLIDIHTHGGNGSDTMDADYEAFETISKFHASHGVTSIIVSTLTAPLDDIFQCLKSIRKICNKNIGGSKILGAHIEGPFISAENKGAHQPEFLLTPDADNYKELLEYSDVITTITVSPGLPGMTNFIDELSKLDIIVSGGHDYSRDYQIMDAIKHGMTHTTHFFSSMSSLSRAGSNKYCGLTEITLLDDRLSTEVIADGKHTNSHIIKLVYKCKGPEKMCIVSDCLKVAGLPSGHEYTIGPKNSSHKLKVIVEEGVAMLPDRSSNAGSVTTVDLMLHNILDCSIPLKQAVRMITLTPAEIIGIDKNKGSLEPGKDADICIMDQNFNVRETIIDGKTVYKRI